MFAPYRSRDWQGALEAIELHHVAEHNFGFQDPPADWAEVFVAETT